MSRDFAAVLSWFAIHRLSVTVAAVLATTSAGVAEPAALVENVVGHSALTEVNSPDHFFTQAYFPSILTNWGSFV